MPLALLVNPSSAGGRALKLLPRVEAALDARRVEFRVQRTRGLEHGAEQALRAIEAGEVPVVISGDGLVGAVGGAMAGSETPLGIVPGGRGNDLARVLGIPDRARGGGRRSSSPATAREIDVGEANGQRFLGIASVGFDSEANRIANEITRCAATSSTPTRRCARWRAGSRRASRSRRRASAPASAATRSRSPTAGPMAAACSIAPDAELDDGEFDVVDDRRGRQAPLPG